MMARVEDRQDRGGALVAVIVPAYNAEATLDQTLRSIRGQTHRQLEIAVIDDGSTDRTLAIAQGHALQDSRISVYSQGNAGVAAARNLGIARTRGPFIAPIDADDLWAPEKIERQLRLMHERGAEVGLVYTWFCVIDQQGGVRLHEFRASAEGWVLAELLRRNLVGSGSALMRREAVEQAGGYDTGLHAAGAQGCEDYRLYLQIAERYQFAVVREFLTGYRELPDSMSADADQMVRSRDICIAEVEAKHPELKEAIRTGRMRFLRFMIARCCRESRFDTAAKLLAGMVRIHPLEALQIIWELIVDRSERRTYLRRRDLPLQLEIADTGEPATSDADRNRWPQMEDRQ